MGEEDLLARGGQNDDQLLKVEEGEGEQIPRDINLL